MSRIEHKPLSFSTTMRNPERMASFLGCLKKYDGQLLTSDLILKIIKDVIRNKLYSTMYQRRNSNLKNILKSEEVTYSDSQIDDILYNSPQNHKEAGFERGWDSRFDTWYKLSKEFGFVYYKMGEPIKISQTGHLLIDAYYLDETNSGERIQSVFLNALSKYQTNNPFRRNLNENAPIPLLLNVLTLLKNDKDENGAGIHRKELPFVMCWRNSNHYELYNFIKKFRAKYRYSASDEIIYEECLKLLGSNNQKRFKMSQIVKEGVDDLIRKLRITGVFSLRGLGRFVDINNLEMDKINFVIDNYTTYEIFSDEYDYFSYMGQISPELLVFRTEEISKLDDIRIKALANFSKKYSNEDVVRELDILENNRNSSDPFLKLIDAPTRLEFLTSLSLFKNYPKAKISPNYSIDDEGNPTFTAKGGIADIEVYDTSSESLVEVTLMRNKQQATNEIPAITRHLEEKKSKINNGKTIFSLFIAPQIHTDTKYMCEFSKYHKNLDIIPLTICKFSERIQETTSILEFLTDMV